MKTRTSDREVHDSTETVGHRGGHVCRTVPEVLRRAAVAYGAPSA